MKGACCESEVLSKQEVVVVFQKSNTKGGCFVQKRVNYIRSAQVSHDGTSEVLTVMLDVAEGDPDA